jgi:putative transposase
VFKLLDQMRSRFRRLQVVFADVAYSRNGLPGLIKKRYGWLIQTVLRPVQARGFVALPKRWIVERTFAWLGRYRRHSKDYERNPATSEAMVYIAMIHIMLRRLERA